MARTEIGWTGWWTPEGVYVEGYTVNGWWGCTKVSAACRFCYAESWSGRMRQSWAGKVGNAPSLWGDGSPRWLRVDEAINELEAIARRFDRDGRRRRVFMHSMSDIFEDRPDLVEPRKRLFGALERIGPRLTPLILSKRSDVMLDHANTQGWLPWAWAGVTAETQADLDRRAADLVRVADAAERFLSVEPSLGPLDVRRWLASGVSWVIWGGESGDDARPWHPSWPRSLRDQCRDAGVPFYFKQHGNWTPAVVGSFGQRYVEQALIAPDGRRLSGSVESVSGQAIMRRLASKVLGDLDGVTYHEAPGSSPPAVTP